MLSLELAIEDALYRIRREYERTGGKIYLSFSGGKDSRVVMELLIMSGLADKVTAAFANTRIELGATVRYVKELSDTIYPNMEFLKPRKPFGAILKEYGKPALSKLKSEALSTYQNNMDDPLSSARVRQMISGEAEKGGEKQGFRTMYSLPLSKFHFLHPDREYKVANKCCQYMKKYPFEDYAKENDMQGSFTGIRVAEGGVRSITYTSCVHIKKVNNKDFIMSMPIFDWSDEIVDEFIAKKEIRLSDAYEMYGATRTGCIGFPFSKNIREDLKTLYDHEPNMYKASMKWLGDVYMDQDVVCDWDSEYLDKYIERKSLNEERKQEVIDHFNGEISEIKKPRRLYEQLKLL